MLFIVSGDFSQITPVGDASITKFLQGPANVLRDFVIIELTQGMRQRDDVEFQTALNNYAEGCCTEEDINLFCCTYT